MVKSAVSVRVAQSNVVSYHIGGIYASHYCELLNCFQIALISEVYHLAFISCECF
jgi:hypothetical protein